MRRFAHLLIVVGAALLVPGCYGYNAQTADLAFLPLLDVQPEVQPEDVIEVEEIIDVIADTTEDEVGECTCTCEPQPCTCTCIPGGTCEFSLDDFPATGRNAGDPCTEDKQCFTDGVCFTTELAGGFYPGAVIPDGICTRLMCVDDASCGEGGVCLDSSKIATDVPKLCGRPCQTDIDCRCGVNYVCVDSLMPDGQGGTIKTCLPDSLSNLLKCGETVCPEGDL